MSNTIKFIDTVIRNIKSANKRQIFWCDSCPGFGLRVTESGSKSFVFKYMVNITARKRASRWITIGKYPEWTIRKARREYDLLYEQVHDYGRDPVQEKKTKQEKENNRLKVKILVREYLDTNRMKEKASIDEEERFLNKDLLPVIGEKFVDEVNAEDIGKIQTNIFNRSNNNSIATRNGKVAIKHIMGSARRIFKLAIQKNIRSDNPVEYIEHLGITGERDRVLSFQELWKFWNGIEDLVPPVTAKALKFGIVTMQRSKEVRNMTYSAYKENENVWHMERKDTKSKRIHRVPLNRYARKIIQDVSAFTGASKYVFGATRAKAPPKKLNSKLIPFGKSAFPQAVRRNRKSLGIDDICPHDLRRTGATWITAVGLPKLYARLMLNHSDGDNDVTGKVYIQYSYDFEKQRAAKVWEYILDQIVTCKSIDDIPTLDELRDKVKRARLL